MVRALCPVSLIDTLRLTSDEGIVVNAYASLFQLVIT